jgi:hypothetical protein
MPWRQTESPTNPLAAFQKTGPYAAKTVVEIAISQDGCLSSHILAMESQGTRSGFVQLAMAVPFWHRVAANLGRVRSSPLGSAVAGRLRKFVERAIPPPDGQHRIRELNRLAKVAANEIEI